MIASAFPPTVTSEPLRIRIRSDWDAALTYDALDEPPGDRPVFVGRDTLIAPLVAEIVEPNKRGTYLISGYRGTGKTTLLIEALLRAQKQLDTRKHKLFPLVLNVSEVAASLGTVANPTAGRLDIDPRRLLIALLRTIAHRVRAFARGDQALQELADRAAHAYQKATAARFTQTSARGQETTREHMRALSLAFEDKNILRAVAWCAGAAAAAVEAVAFVAPAAGSLHAAGAALAAVAVVGASASIRWVTTSKATATEQMAAEHDNSLQQLETDLKDILAELKHSRLRTVVVMEELDKIDDPDGQQLDAVIRYFKNLFTQAPALFFFVTDKSYFDVISTAIKRARRSRSYAVEHTFFTHRVFVGRPTTEESLEFIRRILVEERDRAALATAAETLGKPGRIDEADLFGRFIRVVLFRAANHLFDLKNELRRFVRNQEETVEGVPTPVTRFVIGEQTFPTEEAALAVFQDLIIEKSRSFEIKGGRAYANETLADCLYGVFNELGSNDPQKVEAVLPFARADRADGLLLDEQLDLNEAARVRDAVRSLINDLERGRAFRSRDAAADTFTWRDDAARAFRYVRQLEKHEEALIAELQRHAGLIRPLAPPDAGAHPFVEVLEKRVSEVRASREPLSADAAAEELREIGRLYATALTDAFSSLLAYLGGLGFNFEPIATGVGGSLHFVRPNAGDPRLSPSAPRGGVLLALGEMETLAEDVSSFIDPKASPSLNPLERVALVHVLHGAGDQDRDRRGAQWAAMLSQRFRPPMPHAVDVVPLDPDPDAELATSQRVAAALAAFGAWARSSERPYENVPHGTPQLFDSFEAWMNSADPLLHLQTASATAWRPLFERDPLEADGRVVLNPSMGGASGHLIPYVFSGCKLLGFQQSQGAPDELAPLGRWLLTSRRVVLYFNIEAMGVWTYDDVRTATEAGGKVIVAWPATLPPDLDSIEHTTIRAGGSEAAAV